MGQPTPGSLSDSLLNFEVRTSTLKTTISTDSLRGCTGSLEIQSSSEAETEQFPLEPTLASNNDLAEIGRAVLPGELGMQASYEKSDVLQSNVDFQVTDSNNKLTVLQWMLEDETEGSACSDLSAITAEDQQGR